MFEQQMVVQRAHALPYGSHVTFDDVEYTLVPGTFPHLCGGCAFDNGGDFATYECRESGVCGLGVWQRIDPVSGD